MAKIFRQAHLVREGQLLFAEKDDAMFQEGGAQIAELLVAERLGQINIAYFGANMWRRGGHRNLV
jgi:hypothetical protein